MLEGDIPERYEMRVCEGGYGLLSRQPQYYKELGRVDRYGNIVNSDGERVYPQLPVSLEEDVVGAFFEKPPEYVKSIDAYQTQKGELQVDVTMPDRDGRHQNNYDLRANLTFNHESPNDEELVVVLKNSMSVLDWAFGGRKSPVVQTHLVVTEKKYFFNF